MGSSVPVLEPVREAFDRAAPSYDDTFGTSPSGLLFRRVFQERLLRVFPVGARVLDVGCGTGEDALALAESGRLVHAIDASPGMIQRARLKAQGRGIDPSRLRLEVRAAEDLADLAANRYDGAYSDFGALNCVDPGWLRTALARALRPGARVVLSLMGRHPLPAFLHRLLTGRGEPRGRRTPLVAGVAVPAWYATLHETRGLLAADFAWRGARALGVLVPGPDHDDWVRGHPQAFGCLAAFESLVRGWPWLCGLGDHVVIEGVRR